MPPAAAVPSVGPSRVAQTTPLAPAPAPSTPAPAASAQSKPAGEPDKFEKLVAELIAAKKSDEAILEAVTLATLSRLPTDSEKKLVLASIATCSKSLSLVTPEKVQFGI